MNLIKIKQFFLLTLLVGLFAVSEAKAQFSSEAANVTYSIERYKGEYEVQLIPTPQENVFELRFSRENKTALAIPAHSGTVFREVGGVLYYASYSPTASGCTIVAYNLKDQKELWRTALQALGQVGHSYYSNEVNLGANAEFISVYGKETYGGYYEKLEAKTGKTVVNQRQ